MFFRNDDVGWAHEQLDPVLDVFAARAVPLDLAVIPAALDAPAAVRLRAAAGRSPNLLAFHTHGFAHVNHEPTGRRCEFGPSRPAQDIATDLARGRDRLKELLGALALPFFTPPWNRCAAGTGHALVALGYRVLLRDRSAGRLDIPGLLEIPISVDWLKRPEGLASVAHALAADIGRGGPVGIMLHHARIDRDDLRQLDALLALLSTHPRVSCRSLAALAVELETPCSAVPRP